MSISYDGNHHTKTVSRNGAQLTFWYDANGQRVKQQKVVNSVTTITLYLGGVEKIIKTGDDYSTVTKDYIGGHSIITLIEDGYEDSPLLSILLKDRLGSVSVVLNGDQSSPGATERRDYDAFGKPIVLANPNLPVSFRVTQRGFTEHEHLTEVELIHMNGRAFDYNTGRFLSVDPFIQSPGNTQSINPYSYIMNNPLSGTDPSGYRAQNASNWRTSECDFDPQGCSSTPVDKALAKYVGNGEQNRNQNLAKSLEKFHDRIQFQKDAVDKVWSDYADRAGSVTITDLPSGTIVDNPNGTFYFGGAGLNGDYISGMKDALEEAGISGVTTIGPEGLSASSLISGGAPIDAAIGYLALNEKMNGFPHSLGLPDSGSEQFNMIGYSFGSLLAAQFAAKYADAGFKVDNLVLVGSPISKKFLTELQGHKNIRNVIIKDLTSHGDPIRAGMSVSNPIQAYKLITTLGSQDEQKNGSGHFYYRCTNCGSTGQQRRKQLAQELYDEGLR